MPPYAHAIRRALQAQSGVNGLSAREQAQHSGEPEQFAGGIHQIPERSLLVSRHDLASYT